MDKYQSPGSLLPDEHMRLVGIIAAHWEWIEFVLERAIAEIMEFKLPRVAMLTTNISFYPKCDLILIYARIFENKEPDTWKRFTTTLETLRQAYATRNEYVHAKWAKEKGVFGKSTIRTKGGKLTAAWEPVTVEELSKAAGDIWAAGTQFIELMRDQGILLLPLRDKSGEPPAEASHDPVHN